VIDRMDAKAKLNNGVEMPYLGLGVYLLSPGKQAEAALKHALEIGYRLFDTGRFYGNEFDVGEAVRKGGVPREELFVTTKLWNSDHGYEKAISACKGSLESLGLKYIDLFLIHWPVEGLRNDSWKALEKMYEEGKFRAIGVSNYTISHLQDLMEHARIIPAVNQVEFSPFLYQRDMLEFCRQHDIQLEAYSPLTRGIKLSNRIIVSMAQKYQKTAAQIMLRWALEHQVVIIPKSAHEERLRENADIFDFTIEPSDMEILNNLNENFRVAWDPTYIR
jgi:diketogulonate reductase-like aldo/keto reductase